MTTPLWRRPIWLLGHVIALTACVTFVRLGIWQLDRLDERRERNAVVESRSTGEPVDALSVVRDEDAQYRRVVAEGRWMPDGEITIRNRTLQGSVGRHVVTPLELADGSWLYVNRGWVPVDVRPPPPCEAEESVEGVLRASETRRSIGPRDPSDGVLTELNRVDLGRLQAQVDAEVVPVWLQLESSSAMRAGCNDELPIPLDPLPLDEGPHLSYAMQWFLFTAVVGIGYPLLLRRRIAQSDEGGEPAVDGEHLAGDVAGVVGQQEHDG